MIISLTCVAEGSMVTAEGPRPEKLILEAWGLVGGILEEFLLLGPRGKVVEPYGALGSLPRRSLLQRQQIAHLHWGWLTPALNMI